MEKVYDLAVVVGTYQKGNETKNKYQTIGAVMKNDKGMFMFLNKSFNPAGISSKEGSESIIISMFPPKQKDGLSENFNDNSIPF